MDHTAKIIPSVEKIHGWQQPFTVLGQDLQEISSLGGHEGSAASLVMQDLFSVLDIDFPSGK